MVTPWQHGSPPPLFPCHSLFGQLLDACSLYTYLLGMVSTSCIRLQKANCLIAPFMTGSQHHFWLQRSSGLLLVLAHSAQPAQQLQPAAWTSSCIPL